MEIFLLRYFYFIRFIESNKMNDLKKLEMLKSTSFLLHTLLARLLLHVHIIFTALTCIDRTRIYNDGSVIKKTI